MLTTTQQRFKFVDVDTMNDVLNKCKNKIKYFEDYNYLQEKGKSINLNNSVFIVDKTVRLEVLLKYEGVITRYICFKDGRDAAEGAVGASVFKNFSQYWKTPRYDIKQENEDGVPLSPYERVSASPTLDFNPEYVRTRQQAWGYDLNSAYSAAMLKGWIDTSKPPKAKRIDPEKEVGFRYDDDEDRWVLQHSGYCLSVFEKCETPPEVRKYIAQWYYKKKLATQRGDKIAKMIAKQHLNFVVGYWQRVNPWLRTWIVCSCNEFIENLLDENSLFWNTDSIVSRVRRYDLEEDMGSGIGQWKLEHEGVVAYIGNSYQWNNEVPTYRGQVKSWFPKDWDILKDPLPVCGNAYWFDKENLELKEIEYAIG